MYMITISSYTELVKYLTNNKNTINTDMNITGVNSDNNVFIGNILVASCSVTITDSKLNFGDKIQMYTDTYLRSSTRDVTFNLINSSIGAKVILLMESVNIKLNNSTIFTDFFLHDCGTLELVNNSKILSQGRIASSNGMGIMLGGNSIKLLVVSIDNSTISSVDFTALNKTIIDIFNGGVLSIENTKIYENINNKGIINIDGGLFELKNMSGSSGFINDGNIFINNLSKLTIESINNNISMTNNGIISISTNSNLYIKNTGDNSIGIRNNGIIITVKKIFTGIININGIITINNSGNNSIGIDNLLTGSILLPYCTLIINNLKGTGIMNKSPITISSYSEISINNSDGIGIDNNSPFTILPNSKISINNVKGTGIMNKSPITISSNSEISINNSDGIGIDNYSPFTISPNSKLSINNLQGIGMNNNLGDLNILLINGDLYIKNTGCNSIGIKNNAIIKTINNIITTQSNVTTTNSNTVTTTKSNISKSGAIYIENSNGIGIDNIGNTIPDEITTTSKNTTTSKIVTKPILYGNIILSDGTLSIYNSGGIGINNNSSIIFISNDKLSIYNPGGIGINNIGFLSILNGRLSINSTNDSIGIKYNLNYVINLFNNIYTKNINTFPLPVENKNKYITPIIIITIFLFIFNFLLFLILII